jgi:hypothetical protein
LQHAILHYFHVAEAITTSLAALRWESMFPITSTGSYSIMLQSNLQHKTQTLCVVLRRIKKGNPFFNPSINSIQLKIE